MKYKILKGEHITYKGRTLYRIKALKDFNDVKKGDIGGYIEDYKNLSQEGNAWIFDNAKVFDDAFIKDNAKVSGNASVFGTALVEGNAEISGSAKIFNDPYIGGNARIRNNVKIYSFAIINGNADIRDNSEVSGNSKVYDNAVICGNAEVFDYAVVCGDAEVSDDAKVFGSSSVNGNVKVKENAKVYDSVVLKFGIMTKDIKEDLKQLIACSLNIYPVKGKYILYKRVNKIGDGIYRSLYDPNFIYRKGKTAEVKDYDPNFNVSCGRGLHVSTPFYWSGGDTLIAVEVKLKDVITCMQGKLRVKKLKVIGEV